ncbi:DUF4136 domain-containing protein [Sulfurimonas sp. CVO]|jgi:hypothetical protein|uniref:DUF4136 domain-containing protein n=1 Tax=Sulfurimonas sp. CVO TaxID=2283483 RepID=UPI000CAA9F5F|nr:DUF4136 domain-containing protein [Sulfurimonas sp. CVO]PLY13576.1 MAG: hypothetical protein C0628_06220 [Sulfurimonas sp.]QHG91132.1 DUF4136 domain-containing protein [Sulfurimonas sp. CVO]
MFKYIIPFLLLFIVGCATKKPDIDYDPAFQINTLSAFSVVYNAEQSYDTLNDERIREAIVNEMELKGYLGTAKERADFHIDFKSSIKEDVPSNVGVGFGVGTFTRSMGFSMSTANQIIFTDEETILINMIDPNTKKTFWSTSITQDKKDFKSPQERTDYYNEIVTIMLKEFPPRLVD